MKEKVYEQWLYSDLTELASSSLPFGLPNERVTYLNGNFTLQLNKIYDISSSAYTQLQKIRKDDIQNSTVSAEKSHQVNIFKISIILLYYNAHKHKCFSITWSCSQVYNIYKVHVEVSYK